MDFRQIFRTSKKDEQITTLQKTITVQNERIAKKDEHIKVLQATIAMNEAHINPLVAAIDKLKEQAERREQAMEALTAEYGKLLAQKQLVEEQLVMAHEGQVNQAEIIATQKRVIADLEREAQEYAVASARYVKDIADLSGQCLHLAAENSTLTQENGRLSAIVEGLQAHALPGDVLAFFRSLHKGDFRSNRNGPTRYDEAKAMLKQYDSEKKEQGNEHNDATRAT